MIFDINNESDLDLVYEALMKRDGYCNTTFLSIKESYQKHARMFNFNIGYYVDKEVYYIVGGLKGKDMDCFREEFKLEVRDIKLQKLLKNE